MIDFILGFWIGYIILSVPGFSSSRREVRVFYHFIPLIFTLLLRIMFVKNALFTTTSVVLSMSGVNSTHLFVITGIKAFPENKSRYKVVKSCQKKCVQALFHFFTKKSWTKSCQKVELNSCKLVTVAACRDFVPGLSRDCSRFYFHG